MPSDSSGSAICTLYDLAAMQLIHWSEEQTLLTLVSPSSPPSQGAVGVSHESTEPLLWNFSLDFVRLWLEPRNTVSLSTTGRRWESQEQDPGREMEGRREGREGRKGGIVGEGDGSCCDVMPIWTCWNVYYILRSWCTRGCYFIPLPPSRCLSLYLLSEYDIEEKNN